MSAASAARQSLWVVLSELYLDTELSDADFARIAVKIDKLGFDLVEAQLIDYYEVVPAVGTNLLSSAGVWDGFDKEWLIGRCQKSLKARRGWFFILKCHLLNWQLKSIRVENWDRIAQHKKKALATQ